MSDDVVTLSLDEDFKIEKYEGLHKYNIDDWSTAFALRARYSGFIDAIQDESRSKGTPFGERLERMIKDFILDMLDNPLLLDIKEKNNRAVLDDASIQSVVLNHTALNDKLLKDKKGRDIKNALETWAKADFDNLTDDEAKQWIRATEKIMNTSFHTFECSINNYFSSDPLIQVDLNSTDHDLKEEFEKWLHKKREESKAFGERKIRKRQFSDADLKSWVNNKFLPYLDLEILDKYFNLKLTNLRKAKILFSDEYDIDIVDKTKTTKANIKKMFGGGGLIALHNAAKIYVRERGDKNL